jgi:3-phosphoshikimate 1-carboxyvinyltransferase
MSCKIEKSKLSGKIVCPSNKSYTHRAIILGSLAEKTSIIKNVLQSKDISATIEACKKFGAQVKEAGHDITVEGIKEFKDQSLEIDAQNSGTTIRIAAAVSSLSEGQTVLTGDESLRQRPMQPLLDAL